MPNILPEDWVDFLRVNLLNSYKSICYVDMNWLVFKRKNISLRPTLTTNTSINKNIKYGKHRREKINGVGGEG